MDMPAAQVRPFEIHVSDAVLTDLARRLETTRFATTSANGSWDLGMNPTYLRDLVDYWRTGFDWRERERDLNAFPQFTATVDDTRIHFVHVKSSGASPRPLLLTHGFPDSFHRFLDLVPRLTDAFDIVVPSLPGYAFSEPRPDHGGLFGFGDVLHSLMCDVLGYERFCGHGGDWGSTITEQIARSHGDSVIGVHMTDVPFWHALRKPKDATLAEKRYIERVGDFQKTNGAYAMIQSTRPRTLEAGLTDSPAGLAAWIVEKFREWSGDDVGKRFTKDALLVNVMLYWVTNTIGTSFQPYSDVMSAGAMRWMKEAAKNLVGSKSVPAAFAMFPKDLSSPPREWAERFFRVERWTEMPRGGHFAALEEPDLLADDIREFFLGLP